MVSNPNPLASANANATTGTDDSKVKYVNADALTAQPFSIKPRTAIIKIFNMLNALRLRVDILSISARQMSFTTKSLAALYLSISFAIITIIFQKL